VPSLFQQIQAGQLWDYPGGIHPPTRKELTSQRPIGQMRLPERLYVPLRQHIGVAGRLLVQVGDHVLKGQALTKADNAMAVPVHAPTSGTVVALTSHPSAHPSALPEPVVVIEPDGLEQWRARHGLDAQHTDSTQLLQRIQQAGIAGMGGAGFPTHIKAGAAAAVDYLIINAVECEPYITADDVLMQHHADTIVTGIEILSQLLQPKAVLIGIENDKPAAISAMQAATTGKPHWYVRALPVKYPSGGEKQLIQILTNKEVPSGRRPIDIGIVVQNVGTAFAIAQAVVEDIPLISRVVTVTGDTLRQAQNLYALVGTPVNDLLNNCGYQPAAEQRLIMGGPMMGFTLPDASIPVVKTTNCIIAPTADELPATGPEMDCIRCGACTEACPASLLPQQLLWYSKAADQTQLQAHNLQDCIECGACAFVCPSEIPLVHYYRVAKADIRETQREALKAEQAKARFEARKERLEAEKQERAERNKQLAAQRQQQLADQQKAQIAQAQARVQATATSLSHDDIVAERERKKAEARAYQAAKQAAQTADATDAAAKVEAPSTDDPRKAAVAAALARAKAKKAAHADTDSNINNQAAAAELITTTDEPLVLSATVDGVDAKKAAVAAAIARAKAKKAAPADTDNDTNNQAPAAKPITTTDEPLVAPATVDGVDAKKAAVAAAIARAKAKKAAQETSELDTTAKPFASEPAAEHSPQLETAPESASTVADTAAVNAAPADPVQSAKQAAIAAAIARAKAKKAVQATSELDTTAEPFAPEQAAEPSPQLKTAPESASTVADTAAVNPAPADPAQSAKQAAIAAAIARAKAKKAAQDPKEPS